MNVVSNVTYDNNFSDFSFCIVPDSHHPYAALETDELDHVHLES